MNFLAKPQFLDEFYFLGKGLFDAARTGHPGQFFQKQNVGLLGGGWKAAGEGIFGPAKHGYARALTIDGFKGAVKDGSKFLKTGWDWSYGAMWPILGAAAAYNASKAPPGEKLGAFAGRAAGDFMGATLGAAAFGMPGALIGSVFFGSRIGDGIARTFSQAQSYQQRRQSLKMGGGYYNFTAARTMRQVAAADMSSSLLNARQYLGWEAQVFHQ